MAVTFEKPLKNFLKNFQKDLNILQKTLKKESDDLLKRVKTAAGKENVQAKRKELEKLLEKNMKKYEPTISKFVAEVNKNAKKAGVDLTDLEKKVRDNLHTARTRLTKASATVKSRTTTKGKKAAAPAKKSTASVKKAAAPAKKATAATASVGANGGHE